MGGRDAVWGSLLDPQLQILTKGRIANDKKYFQAAWSNDMNEPAQDWPQEGAVDFQSFSTRYRPGLDLVLKDFTCSVKPGEKIGIVGRTGAGKSSLALALFRIIEAASGHISIDGIRISDLGLHDLRSRLTIIPQVKSIKGLVIIKAHFLELW